MQEINPSWDSEHPQEVSPLQWPSSKNDRIQLHMDGPPNYVPQCHQVPHLLLHRRLCRSVLRETDVCWTTLVPTYPPVAPCSTADNTLDAHHAYKPNIETGEYEQEGDSMKVSSQSEVNS